MPSHLYGPHEIAERLGVTRQRVHQLASQPGWPAPYDTLAMGSVWRKEDIELWISIERPDLMRLDRFLDHPETGTVRERPRRDRVS